ncbi:MAG TPA: amidohydrolase family protein [Gemmataceae bacterium]|nr:amidohydrolase family protein [Gemmataceae bacterium]
MAPWTLTARWVFPVAGPPLQRGTVTIDGGRITAVEPHGTRAADVDLGNAAVLPGLVNAHTHLDLSGARGLAPPAPSFTARLFQRIAHGSETNFTSWLRKVVAFRRSRTPDEVQADIRAGQEECLRSGTTLVGDIASGGASWEALANASLRAVVFFELLGVTEERAERAAGAAKDWLISRQATPTCRPGISPHAPYSVRAGLFGDAIALAHNHQIRLAMHLAETAAEGELLQRRRGPFVAFLKELGAWDPEGLLKGPPTRALRLWSLPIPALFIHANFLPPTAAVSRLTTIVYCPRTHAAFGHPPHPFRDFLRRGVRVALGTDSLASNPDLDLLAEARFVHKHYPDVPGDVLLRMATLSGAEALGWADETGSLEPGKSADLVVLPLPDADAADPHELVFASSLPVRAVLFRGRWVFDGSPAAR